MAPPAETPRNVVGKTGRDAVALVSAAGAVLFALAYVVHSGSGDPIAKTAAPAIASSRSPIAHGAESAVGGAPAKDWTGHLADVVPGAGAPTEPMTSASLVVSPSQLPPVVGPTRAVGKRACEGASCTAKAGGPVPTPPSRPATDGATSTRVAALPAAKQQDRDWPATINPFNHLPDTATLKQPFTYVGDKVAGWFK